MRAAAFAALAFLAGVAAAQPRVGIIYASAGGTVERLAAFRDGMRALGYVEGRDVVIDALYTEGDLTRLPAIAQELVRRKTDVLVSGGPAATRALLDATTTIPIVMVQDNDPVAAGVIASLARPGGSVTGLSNLGATMSAKQLELLKETVPGLARVAVIGTSKEPANPSALAATRRAAAALGLTIDFVDVLVPAAYDSAFRTAAKARADAVLLLASQVMVPRRADLPRLATEQRTPAIFPDARFVDAGGLMSYATAIPELDRRAATYVDKILRGAKPADLPIEQPAKFELVINLKAAKAIGLAVPSRVLLKADRLID